jgi:hypothetical protein
VNRRGAASDFAASFAKAGHYTARLPMGRATTLVAFDSVVWSARYKDDCGSPSPRAGQDELDWLTTSLQAAKTAGASVWLASHIPPGVDVFKTLKANVLAACPVSPVSFYAEPYTDAVLGVFATFSGTVTQSYGGHTHSDDFRLFPAGPGAPPIPHKVVPSITPLFGNAPGFLVMTFNRETGAVVDYALVALGPNPATPQAWKPVYDFDAAYGQREISGVTMTEVRKAIDQPASLAHATYVQNSNAASLGRDAWRGYACAMNNVTAASFAQCYCGGSDH